MSDIHIQTWNEPLNTREVEVLDKISQGLSNREIAQKMHLSTETIKWYNKQIFKKLGVTSRTQAAHKAREMNLLGNSQEKPAEKGFLPLNNLPSQLTSYVGREKEIAEIKQMLQSARLVTLTGPGGIGKTRLALQVASELVEQFRDGVWLVELAPIVEPALVLSAISKVFRITPGSESSLLEVLQRTLAKKHLFLLIDNFEHLLDAAPDIGQLLAAAPKLTVLTTSRESLKLYGEQEYPVPPLHHTESELIESGDKIIDYEAINLFIQRAKAVQPGLTIDDEQLEAIARICARLDGLPLAIELSAPQVKIHPPTVIAQRLEENLHALPSGPRDLPARQRTLRATIEWSYNLLDEDEKTLFTHLAIFNNGGTLQAIETICGQGISRDHIDVITSLVEKNLVIPIEGGDGEIRFTLLETIREYNKELLIENQEAQELIKLHAQYFTKMAEKAEREFRTSGHTYWPFKLNTEHDNLRSALTRSLNNPDPEYALRLIASLRDYWFYYGHASEYLPLALRVLQKADQALPELRAGALYTVGTLAYSLDDPKIRQDMLSEAVEIFQKLGDVNRATWCLINYAITGKGSDSDILESIALVEECLAEFRRQEDKPGIAQALNILGELSRVHGDYAAAKGYYDEALGIVQETGERLREAMLQGNFGYIAYHNQEYQLAEDLMKDAIRIFIEMDSNSGAAGIIGTLAGPTAALGNPGRAACLLGAAEALLESYNTGQQPADQIEIDLFKETIRQELGEKAFLKAREEGQRMTFQEAVTYALKESPE